MPKVTTETLSDWSEGVITALLPDAIPPNASPRGWNSAFYNVGPTTVSVIGTRRGAKILNTTAVTGTPAILENFQYKRLSAGAYTTYHLLVSNAGRLDALDQATFVAAAADAGTPAPFTAGDLFPDYEIANNLAFIVNGTDSKKFNGTAVQNFGLVAPAAAPTFTASGAGAMNGTYEAATTYYNTNTGLESSRSAIGTSGVLAANNLPVVWVASADAQVTHVRVYIRKPTIGTTFVLASTVAIGALTVTLNLSDAQINALITAAPDTAQNNPPPAGIKYLAWHYSRMFCADDTQVYYSQLGQPEAFDPLSFLRVNINDGQKIMGLHSAQEILFIFKERSIWALSGTDPQSWQLRLLVPDIGTVGHRTIVTAEGVTYWWALQGPMRMQGLGASTSIATPFIPTEVGPLNVNQAKLNLIHAVSDRSNERVMWAIPTLNDTRCTQILPFSYRIQRWESSNWNPLDVCSMGVVEDPSGGRTWVHLANYKGRVYRWWDADTDGARTIDGSGTPRTLRNTLLGTALTATTITDATAVFDTTGAGLAQAYVMVVRNDDTTDRQRVRIASNTGTVLTIDTTSGGPSLLNIQAASTYTYYVGAPDFQWDTRWNDGGLSWLKKRYEFLYIALLGLASNVTVSLDISLDYDGIARTIETTFPGRGGSAIWDVSFWDQASWGGASQSSKRIRMGKTGQTWQLRVRHVEPNSPIFLVSLGMRAVILTDKVG